MVVKVLEKFDFETPSEVCGGDFFLSSEKSDMSSLTSLCTARSQFDFKVQP